MEDSTELQGVGFTWIHLRTNDEAAVAALRERFGFHELDLKDVLPPLQRPKVVSREGYLFMIFLFPYYNPARRDIVITEIDFFIGRDFIVSVNGRDEFAPLRDLVTACARGDHQKNEVLGSGIGNALYKILDHLHQAAFPMLLNINHDIDRLEERLFNVRGRGNVVEILRIKTNIVDFRRAMQGHKPVVDKLLVVGNGLLETKKLQPYWNDLLDLTKEIWAYLETQRETITALHETHSSLLSHRINEVIKRLTLVSVALLPLTLLASLFGMNLDDIPFSTNPLGFWIVMALLAVTFAGVVGYFKSKDWV